MHDVERTRLAFSTSNRFFFGWKGFLSSYFANEGRRLKEFKERYSQTTPARHKHHDLPYLAEPIVTLARLCTAFDR